MDRSHKGEEQCTGIITLACLIFELVPFVVFHTWMLFGACPSFTTWGKTGVSCDNLPLLFFIVFLLTLLLLCTIIYDAVYIVAVSTPIQAFLEFRLLVLSCKVTWVENVVFDNFSACLKKTILSPDLVQWWTKKKKKKAESINGFQHGKRNIRIFA